jgi:hypothetical protein
VFNVQNLEPVPTSALTSRDTIIESSTSSLASLQMLNGLLELLHVI